eukprot:3782997-Amphidinium_carterae.1
MSVLHRAQARLCLEEKKAQCVVSSSSWSRNCSSPVVLFVTSVGWARRCPTCGDLFATAEEAHTSSTALSQQ